MAEKLDLSELLAVGGSTPIGQGPDKAVEVEVYGQETVLAYRDLLTAEKYKMRAQLKGLRHEGESSNKNRTPTTQAS